MPDTEKSQIIKKADKKASEKKREASDEKLLGIDYGSANVGLAFGSSKLTMPLTIISGKNRDRLIHEIAKVAYENKVNKIVVGLPVDENGKLTPQALEVRHFVNNLKIRVKIPVVFVNESMTTKEALGDAVGMGWAKKRRESLDALAAQIVLKRYYEEAYK